MTSATFEPTASPVVFVTAIEDPANGEQHLGEEEHKQKGGKQGLPGPMLPPIVGDNADELFGGSHDVYFDDKYAHDPEGWKRKRDGMADLPFVTKKIAESYNLAVHQPFMDQRLFVRWALGETARGDCIGKCKIQSRFEGPYEMQNCGKIPLREAFRTVASWRRMDWIFRGSGAAEGDILVDHYETAVGISDDEFESQQIDYSHEGIKIKSKEHLHNIRIFRIVFGGLNHPTKRRYPIGDRRGCVSCCFEIGDEQFCHLCDEYPAQHPKEVSFPPS